MKTISETKIEIVPRSVLDVYHEIMKKAQSYDSRLHPDMEKENFESDDLAVLLYQVCGMLEDTAEVNPPKN